MHEAKPFLSSLSIILCMLTSSPANAGPNYDFDRAQLESVMEDLKAWLPGAWDSYPQVWYERNVTLPEEGEHEHWHRTFALIDAPQVGDVVFYGQINIGGRDGPLMPRSEIVYKVYIDEARGVVVMNGQPPSDVGRFANLQDHPELWSEVRMRDPSALNCDFIWRRDGEQLMAVLEGKTEERRKYGPGTCSYISSSGAEFFGDAEWVLTPDELWVYDTNKLRGVQFIGRKDLTHTRLYRARPYRCELRMGADEPFAVLDAHDRGFAATFSTADDETLQVQLLRAWFPGAAGTGLDDELRLTLSEVASGQRLATATAAPRAARIELSDSGISITCAMQDRFGPLSAVP